MAGEETNSIKEKLVNDFEAIKSQLNSKIVDNPKFVESYIRELKSIYYKTGKPDYYSNVAFDGNSVTISSYNPVIDCAQEEFIGKNKSCINVVFRLNGDNLFVEYNHGVLFDRRQLEKSGLKSFARYETKFETTYSLQCFNKDGVEYSNSSYSDDYPLSDKSDDIDIREKVMSSFYKPTFYEYSLPKAPIHILKAIARNIYRKEGSYYIIHMNRATMTADGYHDVTCMLFTTHPLFLDILRGSCMIAKSVEQNGNQFFEVEKSFADSIENAYEKAKESFKKDIDNLKEKLPEITIQNLIQNM